MESNDTTQTNQQPKYNFEERTYNGISVKFETITGYFNASQMCSANIKKWRDFKKSKCWRECIEIYNEFILPKLSVDFSTHAKISFEPENVANEWRGEYVHPKLIHFVAEYCSKRYAFMVSQLMDSINESVHQQLQQENKPDTPENAQPIFEQKVNTISHIVSDNENSQCWGIREHDKFDYLDSWDKDNVRRMFEQFKQDILKQINISFEELKRDYPQLIE